ncbi:MAG TPA: ABC transporter permease [Rhodospirillaceae bacterium]|nr:MAG: ABC transporter permease [Alphaproteobacteria bacterium GWF2_58_20]HAU29538.1 ABC transporter permease [Rhodospirillaceae bacterium]
MTTEARLDFLPSRDGTIRLSLSGRIEVEHLATIAAPLEDFPLPASGGSLVMDMTAADTLDTAGAIMILRMERRCAAAGIAFSLSGLHNSAAQFLAHIRSIGEEKTPPPPIPHPVLELLERTGRATFHLLAEIRDILGFFGMLSITLIQSLRHPSRLRGGAILTHMEQVGLNALPIVGLLSFLIGVVLAYQGADQLQKFGAELLVVNILGVSILREIGILITAIIVAGRSGSAFTAQIGTMKVNQEIDAMLAMGLSPIEYLVQPRIFALVLTLPLLAFYADITALIGGATMCYMSLDITYDQFLLQFQNFIKLRTLLVGLVKAPFFAFAIAMIGCYQGLKVSGSAESVGRLTTKSVVQSIFLVIALDALFSIIFAKLHL